MKKRLSQAAAADANSVLHAFVDKVEQWELTHGWWLCTLSSLPWSGRIAVFDLGLLLPQIDQDTWDGVMNRAHPAEAVWQQWLAAMGTSLADGLPPGLA